MVKKNTSEKYITGLLINVLFFISIAMVEDEFAIDKKKKIQLLLVKKVKSVACDTECKNKQTALNW